MIVESFLVSADTVNLLQAPSRLNSIPYAGTLTLEMSATDCTAANNMKFSIQTPDGETPYTNVLIPFGGDGTNLALDSRTEIVIQLEVRAGGHVNIDMDETGTCEALVWASLSP